MNCQEFWNTLPELGDSQGHQHPVECPACAARLARHRELEAGFRALAASSRRMEAPARVETRLLKEFRRQAGSETAGGSRRWVPVLTWAAALAAMVALAVFLVRPREPEAVRPAPHRVELAMLQPSSTSVQMPIPLGGVVSNLQVRLSGNPGNGRQYAFTVVKNGVATGLTCTVAGSSATSCTDTDTTVWTAGDVISLQSLPSSPSLPTSRTATWSVSVG